MELELQLLAYTTAHSNARSLTHWLKARDWTHNFMKGPLTTEPWRELPISKMISIAIIHINKRSVGSSITFKKFKEGWDQKLKSCYAVTINNKHMYLGGLILFALWYNLIRGADARCGGFVRCQCLGRTPFPQTPFAECFWSGQATGEVLLQCLGTAVGRLPFAAHSWPSPVFWFFCLFVCLFLSFLGPHTQHMEVPRLGV